MVDLKLIEPTPEYAGQIKAYRKEFLDNGDSMDGTSGLRRYEDPQDWLKVVSDHKDPKTVQPGHSPATQYIFVRESDRKIVGMIDIRHVLTDYLSRFGGHIGYSVAPSERRKGYASQMLKRALQIVRGMGIERVLITCDEGNEGSARTIMNNGGIYESTVYEPDEQINLERYWIDLKAEPKNYIKWIRSKVGHEKIILTCAGGCVFNDAGAVLMQRRGDTNKWGFPGGMMELGETPQMTAVRELKEETGLDVEVGDLIGVFTDIDVRYANGDVAQCIVIGYRLNVVGGTLTCDGDETLELRYFSKDEKPEIGSPAHEEVWNVIFGEGR